MRASFTSLTLGKMAYYKSSMTENRSLVLFIAIYGQREALLLDKWPGPFLVMRCHFKIPKIDKSYGKILESVKLYFSSSGLVLLIM